MTPARVRKTRRLDFPSDVEVSIVNGAGPLEKYKKQYVKKRAPTRYVTSAPYYIYYISGMRLPASAYHFNSYYYYYYYFQI